MIIVPLVRAWLDGDSPRRGRGDLEFTLVALSGAVGGLGVLALWSWNDVLVGAAGAVLIWSALRLRVWGASTVVLVGAAVTDWVVVQGTDAVDPRRLTTGHLFGVQLGVGVIALTALILGAALEERDRAHDHRQMAVERYRRTVSSAPIGIALTTLDGTVLEANPALATMLGYPRTQLVGRVLDDFRNADDSDGEPTEAVATGEQRLRAADGSLVWVEVSETAVRSLHGEPAFRVVSMLDVTRAKTLEDHLIHAQKMEAVGRLTGGVAHDFNNLLAVMRGHVEIIEEDLAVLEGVRARLASVQRATDRAAAITDDLVAFSRRGADEVVVVDVHEILTGLQDMLGQVLGDAVAIAVQPRASEPWVRADPSRVEQALVNLVINARDAMPAGGRVTILTANTTDESGRPQVVIRVSDTGVGMAPEVQARIFEAFFTTKPRGSGTGLGLAITSGIVEGYGGTITVESIPRVGTTFTITLPGAAAPPVPRLAEPVLAPPMVVPDDVVNGTVLVVDDEDELGALAAKILRDAGYHVLHAAEGPTALRMAEAADPPIDVVLVDVVMPAMGGPELLARLRELVPGVEGRFMSGYAEVDPHAPGFDDVPLLRKPIPRADLLGEVAAAMSARHATHGSKR